MKLLSAVLIAMVFVGSMFVTGCFRTEEERAGLRIRRATSLLNSIIYIQDRRAKPPACFGFIDYGEKSAAFTVPCESVEHLLVNKEVEK